MSDEATVGVVGNGPAVEAVQATLEEGGRSVRRVDVSAVSAVDLAVVAAAAGDDRFGQTNAARDRPWLAVELGGIGGLPVDVVDASVAALDPAGPCYDCLGARVRSTLDGRPAGPSTATHADERLAGTYAGRVVLDALVRTDVVGQVIELPYAERTVLPVPGCSCVGDRSRSVRSDHASVDFETTVRRAERGVDHRLGPVASIGEAESFPAPYYLASLADTTGFSDVRASQHAAGVAADWNPAFVKAVGEALERYSAGVYRAATFTTGAAAELEGAVPPSRFVRPDDGFEDPAPDEPIDWVPGEDLKSGAPVHLPAERVHFPPPEEQFGPSITTGLGLGTSGAGALVSGLTEVVERDATMLGWYSTFEPLGLAVDDPGFETLARRARSEDLEVTALLMTQDVDVPVVSAAVHREGEWPQFAVGSGAALDPVAAALGALEEALQNWMELRGMGSEEAAEEEPTLARYADFPPEAQEFVSVDDGVPAASVGPDELPTGAEVLPALLDRVADAGLDAYGARLTPRDVEALGFEAVRVLVPEAQPLFAGDRFFGERARTVPRELGFRPRLDRPPHPYP